RPCPGEEDHPGIRSAGERAQGRRAARRPHGRAPACRHGAPHGRDRTGDRAAQAGGRTSLEGRNFAPSRALSRWTIGRTHMPEIRENTDIVTQITTVKVPPKNQSEVLARLHGWACETRTQKRRRKISLCKIAQISGDQAEF